MKYFGIENIICKTISHNGTEIFGEIVLIKIDKFWRKCKYKIFLQCFVKNVIEADDEDLSNLIEYSGE